VPVVEITRMGVKLLVVESEKAVEEKE